MKDPIYEIFEECLGLGDIEDMEAEDMDTKREEWYY